MPGLQEDQLFQHSTDPSWKKEEKRVWVQPVSWWATGQLQPEIGGKWRCTLGSWGWVSDRALTPRQSPTRPRSKSRCSYRVRDMVYLLDMAYMQPLHIVGQMFCQSKQTISPDLNIHRNLIYLFFLRSPRKEGVFEFPLQARPDGLMAWVAWPRPGCGSEWFHQDISSLTHLQGLQGLVACLPWKKFIPFYMYF